MCRLIISQKNITKKQEAEYFCFVFLSKSHYPKYILGRNIYARSVLEQIQINGIIDDFTDEKEFLGLPIFKTHEIEKEALVLNAAGGRPLSAKKILDELGVRNLDYFSFFKYSGLSSLVDIVFNENFSDVFFAHISDFEWIYDRFADEVSRYIFRKLINFRLHYDIDYLHGFCARESEQYFEDFLNLAPNDETFIDVGGFDGYTALKFIKHCPDYRAIHVFEPEPENYRKCLAALHGMNNTYCYQLGLSNKKQSLHFSPAGSASRISDSGSLRINVDRLDDILPEDHKPTFIKMDIEGAEAAAIEGAKETIARYHPRLAIAVYHNPVDFWRIPRAILSLHNNYRIYLRHYTESIYETIMFFV